ncbi:hypothetical protein BKA64DRAFT_725763 [Cadophora sp. MPI-SDFR-AT-0126]|nr:hypothetical protein BKA64DRAFT_725763 [Leotiomycetes sp. MPI-SDFR-AT-0126]
MTSPTTPMDTFLSSPSPSISKSPFHQILTKISTHQRSRKASDDETARKLKDKMIVEYRNQSEQHEKLTTEFVGRVQDGLGGLVANLLCQDARPQEELRAISHETLNTYILNHLSTYQKAVKRQKLNSRQRTDRFSSKSLARYKETLEKDESDLLDLFQELEDVCEKTSNGEMVRIEFGDKCDLPMLDSADFKGGKSGDDEKAEILKREACHDSDSEMEGFCISSSDATPSQPRRDKKRKLE